MWDMLAAAESLARMFHCRNTVRVFVRVSMGVRVASQPGLVTGAYSNFSGKRHCMQYGIKFFMFYKTVFLGIRLGMRVRCSISEDN